MFFGEMRRRQLVLEVGAVQPTDGRSGSATAAGFRFQQALGQRIVLVLDGFGGLIEDRAENYGARTEILVKF